jgi:hypothetical protein
VKALLASVRRGRQLLGATIGRHSDIFQPSKATQARKSRKNPWNHQQLDQIAWLCDDETNGNDWTRENR